MKRLFIILALPIVITSCGSSKSGDPASGSKSDPVLGELTKDESTLASELKEKGVMTQKELIQKLISFNSFNQQTLKRLDQTINVQCIHSSGLCYINQKD